MDYRVMTEDADGVIAYKSGESPNFVKGIQLLIHMVAIELISDPVPNVGGSGFISGLRRLSVGSPEARSVLSTRLRNARANILLAQQDAALSEDEQLRSLDLVGLRESSNGWEADIQLVSVAGTEVRRTVS